MKANPEWVKELEIMVATKVQSARPFGVSCPHMNPFFPPAPRCTALCSPVSMQFDAHPRIQVVHKLKRFQACQGCLFMLVAMRFLQVKAEIQALSSFGFQYLSQVYLPLKLQEGDWIWGVLNSAV